MNLDELTAEIAEWGKQNFPNATTDECFLGVVEEVGELSHAILKRQQGIRGTREEHDAEAQDAVGDIIIFLHHLCAIEGWDFDAIIAETWGRVKQRDWQNDPGNGNAQENTDG